MASTNCLGFRSFTWVTSALPRFQAQTCTRQAIAKPRPDLSKKQLLGIFRAEAHLCRVCECPCELDILEPIGFQHSGRFLGSWGRLINAEVCRSPIQASAFKARYLKP